MARPMYPHELGDPDFSWLISTFLEQRPNFIQLDSSCLPVVLLEGVPGVGARVPALNIGGEVEDEVDAVVGEE